MNCLNEGNPPVIDVRLSSLLIQDGNAMETLFSSVGQFVTRNFKAGKKLFSENTEPEGVYLLKKGRVKLTKEDPEGKQKTVIGMVTPVCYLGLCSLIRNKKHNSTATCVEDSTVEFISRQNFFSLMAQFPSVSHKILVYLCTLLDNAQNELISGEQNNIMKKITDTLSVLFRMNEKNTANSIILTPQSMAKLAGTSLEATLDCLNALCEKKIISMEGNQIILMDKNAINNL